MIRFVIHVVALALLGGAFAVGGPAMAEDAAPIGQPEAAVQEAAAQEETAQEEAAPALPVTLEADNIDYDHNSGVVTASGNVVVEHAKLRLTSNRLTYDVRNDVVLARDGVVIVDEQGYKFEAKTVELKRELSEGVIEQLRLSMRDEAWITADEAVRENNSTARMKNAAFSPCKVCEENPTPLWAIRADEVVHDADEKNVIYHDAQFEFMGIPIFWMPYFIHADPTVERRTGLLLPWFDSNSELGELLALPYFWEISPSQDMTITPVLSTREIGYLMADYRERLYNGYYEFDGSFAYVEGRDDQNREIGRKVVRGHIFGHGYYDLNENYTAGFQLENASDDTFLRRYDISNVETLRSTLWLDRFTGLDHLTVDFHAFQGLRLTDDPGQMPFVLPVIDFRHTSKKTYWGGRFYGAGNFLALDRGEGIDTSRAVAQVGWKAPITLDHGALVTVEAKLRGRAVYDRDVPDPANPGQFVQEKWRTDIEPEISLNWQFPFVSPAASGYHLIEPIASVHLSPIDGFDKETVNNDSTVFELDDINLFRANRFSGHDRYESGLRAAIGVRYGYYMNNGDSVSILLGQSYRGKEITLFPGTGGLNDRESDFVGRITASFGDVLSLSHRFRLDQEDLNPLRNEVILRLSPEWFDLEATFVQQDKSISPSGTDAQEEINARLLVPIVQYWSFKVESRHDFAPGGGAIRHAAAFVYQDECFEFEFGVKRRFTEDRDVRPSTSFGVRVKLLYLGGGGRRD